MKRRTGERTGRPRQGRDILRTRTVLVQYCSLCLPTKKVLPTTVRTGCGEILVQYSTVQYRKVQYSAVQCSTGKYSTVQYEYSYSTLWASFRFQRPSKKRNDKDEESNESKRRKDEKSRTKSRKDRKDKWENKNLIEEKRNGLINNLATMSNAAVRQRVEFERLVRKIFFDTTGRNPTKAEEQRRISAFEYHFERTNRRSVLHKRSNTQVHKRDKSGVRGAFETSASDGQAALDVR